MSEGADSSETPQSTSSSLRGSTERRRRCEACSPSSGRRNPRVGAGTGEEDHRIAHEILSGEEPSLSGDDYLNQVCVGNYAKDSPLSRRQNSLDVLQQ